MKKLIMSALLPMMILAGAAKADGPPSPDKLPPAARMGYVLGSAGLMTEFANQETFAKIQLRQGLQRAQIEHLATNSAAAGTYRDKINTVSVPLDLTYHLPNSNGTRFIRVAVDNAYPRGAKNPTYNAIDTNNFLAQFLMAPRPDLMFAIGVKREFTDIDVKHNGAKIKTRGTGLRADYVQKYNGNWGLAARLEYVKGSNHTSDIPLGGGRTMWVDLDYTRTYLQADLVGTFRPESLPQGWIFRPVFSIAHQHTKWKNGITSFGTAKSGTVGDSDDYTQIAARAMFEKPAAMPGKFAPSFTIGVERELTNDVNLAMDDPTTILVKAGGSINFDRHSRLNISASHREGTKHLRRDSSLTLSYNYSF